MSIKDVQSGSSRPAESPPLAPTEMPVNDDALVKHTARGNNPGSKSTGEQFVASERGELSQQAASARPGGKLIVGAGIAVALVLATLAYLFLPLTRENTADGTRSDESAPAAQSAPAAPARETQSANKAPAAIMSERSSATPSDTPPQAAPTAPQGDPAHETQSANQVPSPSTPERSSAMPSGTSSPTVPPALPDSSPPRPAPLPADTPPQLAPTAPEGDTAQRRPAVAAAQNRDVLFLQRAGVNIRSAPSLTSSVVGTAPKGTRFEVTNRDGRWVQVESGQVKGWINASFLAPDAPR